MKSDIEIAQEAKMKPIADIAAGLGLADEDVIPYGRYKAKINHRLIHKASKQASSSSSRPSAPPLPVRARRPPAWVWLTP